MSRATEKAIRLLQIEQLLWAHPEGLTRTEVAKRLEINRSNITKYLNKDHLPPSIYIDDLDGNKLKIDRNADLTKTSFNLHEIMAIHLATRLLATRTDKQNPHAASALRKLGMALQRLDGRISHHLLRSADVMDEDAAFRDPVYLDALQKLTEAWSSGRKVSVSHQMPDGKVFDYTFSPYFIEPYAIGQTAHVIGLREPPGKIRTFKIERLRSVEILREEYTIPDSFDAAELLRNAWGIWYSEAEPEQVLLRFHPTVASRVQETRWHREQRHELQPDGYLLWRAKVAEPQEMLPWIRGWGADVEVVGPVWLREELLQSAKKLSQMYSGVTAMEKLPHFIPYAKTNRRNPEDIHALLYHLIDVGQVALTMWQSVLTDGIRQRMPKMLGISMVECCQLMAFLAALHDIGKAGPAYQKKYAPDWLLQELTNTELGLKGIGKAFEERTPHGTVSTWALKVLLPDMLGWDKRFSGRIATALGGHHGVWPSPGDDDFDDGKYPQWDQVRRDLVSELISVFAPPKVVLPPADTTEMNTFLTILSGLTSVADWIGSRNEEGFGFVQKPMSSRRYAERAKIQAQNALQELGWIGWQPAGRSLSFAEAFAYLNIKAPRPIQEEVINQTVVQLPGTLLILEAPTGLGKTEIALYIAERWLQQHAGRGLYVAMPTQATSNQMYTRVGNFLNHQYPDLPINFHLVHGQAAWADDLKKQVELQNVGDDRDARMSAESWFIPRKRTLLAPFGVGTVDQALMSVLQTKHFFVRLFGLSHKVVIFDEVHAYDTYMNALFHRLLTWLNAMGTSVIVLSATLPIQTRRELVKAYTGQELPDTKTAYPALTIANAQTQQTVCLPKPNDYTLQLDWSVDRDPTSIADFLITELANGGCAAVICNTVARTQGIYRALDAARTAGRLDIAQEDLLLFHSGFPPIWRKEIEATVLNKFAKDGKRPQKAIVVATQVIEQSLDIDFDLMISDLSPVDLILQRAGRLHRHSTNDDKRYDLERKLVITRPETEASGRPDFGIDSFIYAEYILLRSYLTLKDRGGIRIPDDTADLIESVYDSSYLLALPNYLNEEMLQKMFNKMVNEDWEVQSKATLGLIATPEDRQLLAQRMIGLEEENPTVHKTLQAKTRDIDFSITVICLHQSEEGLYIHQEIGQRVEVDLDKIPSADLTKMLLQNAISIQSPWLGKFFVEQKIPSSWKENFALRYCRYAVFEDAVYELPNYRLKLSRDFGLETIKKESVNA